LGEEETIATRLAALRADSGRVDVLVNDGASLFARGGGELTALRACLDGCWRAIQAVANGAFIGDGGEGPGGRIVNLAPAPGAGAHAGAARAGLENLARTLSIEWARHGIVTTTIAPADSSEPEAIARLVAFLASPAGGYYSGCVFTLDALA
jgi:citronellol/citronellal dehydrogenase